MYKHGKECVFNDAVVLMMLVYNINSITMIEEILITLNLVRFKELRS